MRTTSIDHRPGSFHHLLKQAVIGIGDGATILFAITTALSVAYTGTAPIITYALYIVVIGGAIIGIGGFLSARYRMERLAAKDIEAEQKEQDEETEKTIALFKNLQLSEQMQQQAREEIKKDSEEWKTYLENNKQNFEAPEKKELPVTGLIIAASFIAGGILAIIPYFLKQDSAQAFSLSFWTNIPLLLLIGFIKSKVNGEPLLWGSLRLMLLGVATAVAAYLIAGIFVR